MTTKPTYVPEITDAELAAVSSRTISDLSEHAPGTMTVFTACGFDLCCGGGLPLGEALQRHGIDAEPVLREVAIIVAESQDW